MPSAILKALHVIILLMNMWDMYCYFSHFRYKKFKTEKISDLPKVTHLVSKSQDLIKASGSIYKLLFTACSINSSFIGSTVDSFLSEENNLIIWIHKLSCNYEFKRKNKNYL